MNGQLQVRSLGCQMLHEKVDVRRTDQVAVIGWVKQRRRQYLREPRGRPLRLGRGLAKAHFNSASVGALCLRKHGKWFRRQRLTRRTDRVTITIVTAAPRWKGDRPHVPARANTSDVLGLGETRPA